MKKLTVLVLGLTLMWTNNVFSMDDAERESQSIPLTQLFYKTSESDTESKEELPSSPARYSRKDYLDQWGSPGKIIEDQCITGCCITAGCVGGILFSYLLFLS